MNPIIEGKNQELTTLRYELIICGYCVQSWLNISEAKEKFSRLAYESFFGFLQYIAFRTIIVNGHKLPNDTHKYIRSIFDGLISEENLRILIKKSRISNRLNILKTLLNDFKLHRNKRFAHMENISVNDEASCNLKVLLTVLANLDSSLGYLQSYLINPEWIKNQEWDSHFTFTDAEKHPEKSDFLQRMKDDYYIKDSENLLKNLNEKD